MTQTMEITLAATTSQAIILGIGLFCNSPQLYNSQASAYTQQIHMMEQKMWPLESSKFMGASME
jgi:hypothetical protein